MSKKLTALHQNLIGLLLIGFSYIRLERERQSV